MLLLTHIKIDPTDYYEILGIKRGATPREIHKAFLKQSKLYHPDKGGDPEYYKRIREAYDVLKDNEQRFVYDTHGFAEQEVQRAVNTLVDFVIAAYQRGIKTQQQVRKFVSEVALQNVQQANKNLAELGSISALLQEFLLEINEDNFIMRKSAENARSKLVNVARDIEGAKQQLKVVEVVNSLAQYVDLKKKDPPPTQTYNMVMNNTNAQYTTIVFR